MTNDSMLPPRFVYPDDEDRSNYVSKMHFSLMQQAGEPALWKHSNASGYHAYRFQWEGGRNLQGPLVIRLEIQPDGTGIATIKIWKSVEIGFHVNTNYPKYEKRLQINDTKPISARNVKKFLRQIDKIRFWDLPIEDDRLGFDGETWNFEGAKNGNFHFVTRWVPQDKEFRKAGLLLLDACKLPNPWQHILRSLDYEWILSLIENLIFNLSSFYYRLKKGK